MSKPSMLDALFASLPALHAFHDPSGPVYDLIKRVAMTEMERRFGPDKDGPQDFGPFGEIVFPFRSMGAITSLDLFGLDELIIFSFYQANRQRYTRVADIGANLGLHSILLDRCGYDVRAFEPDPIHFKALKQNLVANACRRIEPMQAAVSTDDGEAEFVRVLGNTTGSHLSGAKSNPYGDLERFSVRVNAIEPIMEWADLLKIDAEGHEAAILTATKAAQWTDTDAIIEVGTQDNAKAIFEYFEGTIVSLFAQKNGWHQVTHPREMPGSYKNGSLFLSGRRMGPWGD